MKALFIPSDTYFSDNLDNIKLNLQTKLGYQAYIDIFGTMADLTENGAIAIDLENYQVGELNINMPQFINFSNVIKYRNYWYGWVRGIIFVLLVIYNINQVYKLIRGSTLADTEKYLGGGKDK